MEPTEGNLLLSFARFLTSLACFHSTSHIIQRSSFSIIFLNTTLSDILYSLLTYITYCLPFPRPHSSTLEFQHLDGKDFSPVSSLLYSWQLGSGLL